jgi:DNA gyrase/topoisomerase IV subunit A
VLEEGTEGDLLCISRQGQTIRMGLTDIPSRGRATQGVIVMRLDPPDKVATMSVVMFDKEAEEAMAMAAEEAREGEVEELFEEAEMVEKAAKSSKRKAKK